MSASNNRSKDRGVRGNNDRDERGRKEDEVTIQIVKSVLTKIQAWNLSRLKKLEMALSHASSPQDLKKALTQSLKTTSPQLQTTQEPDPDILASNDGESHSQVEESLQHAQVEQPTSNTNFIFVQTVSGNKEGFTKRQIKGAEAARDFITVPMEQMKLPREVFLTLDIFFVTNKIHFFLTLSRNICYTAVNHLAGRTVSQIFQAFTSFDAEHFADDEEPPSVQTLNPLADPHFADDEAPPSVATLNPIEALPAAAHDVHLPGVDGAAIPGSDDFLELPGVDESEFPAPDPVETAALDATAAPPVFDTEAVAQAPMAQPAVTNAARRYSEISVADPDTAIPAVDEAAITGVDDDVELLRWG